MNMMNDDQLVAVCGGENYVEEAYQLLQEQEKKAADALKLTFAAQEMAQ